MADKSEHDVLTAAEAAAAVGVSERLILDSLRSDDPASLQGRNLKGRKGWVTTRRALTNWIEGGDVGEEEGEAFGG